MSNINNNETPRQSSEKTEEGRGRINILFLINDLKIGGAEKMLVYLISGLDRSIYNPVVCTLLDRGEYKHFLLSHGIKYYSLGMENYSRVPVALFKLVRILKKEKIAVLHSYLFYSDIMARFSGFLARVPVVITSMRNIDLWRKPYHIFIDSLSYGLSSAIISNSLAGAERLSNVERIPSERIKVVYNAINLDEYLPTASYDRDGFRKKLGLRPEDFVVTTVARLEEQKDHRTLLEAARALCELSVKRDSGFAAGRKLRFVLAGDGRLEEELKSYAREIGISDNVIFLGRRTDIRDILHASEMFLLTSVYEGIPNAILEAQACGVPVVSTDVGGVSEIIENNFNGVLCKASDPSDIASRAWMVITSPHFAKRLADNAFEKLKAKFSCRSMITKTQAIYRSLLVQNAPAIAHDHFPPEEFKLKLNILYLITSSDVGGAQKHLISLVKYFLSKNHQIKVATSPGEPMNSSIRRLGVKPVVLNYLQKKVNPLYDLMTFYDISKLLIENDFSVIHCHSTKAGILGRLAAYFAGVPVKVFTAHGFVFYDGMNFFKKYLCVLAEKLGGFFGDMIITVSWADFKKAIRYGIAPRERIRVIQNGIDVSEAEKFINENSGRQKEFRSKYGIEENALLIGSVGRLVSEKAYEVAISAMPSILAEYPKAFLVIAGDGYARAGLEALALKLGVSERVRFLGELAAVYEFYMIMDLFFLSSVKEGLPYSLLEAGAFGIPVVCSDAGGISELVSDGKTGILVPCADIRAFASGMKRALAMDASAREKIAMALYDKIKSDFSEEKMLLSVEQQYMRLAAKKGLL